MSSSRNLTQLGSTASESSIYEALDRTEHVIQLLTIPKLVKSDSDGTLVKTILKTFTFSKRPLYIALSYVWGPPSPNRLIQINNQFLHVRENLYNFLVEASKSKDRQTYHGKKWLQHHYLWIDQICINQDSDEERADQVKHMGHIYANASETVMWLGLEKSNLGPGDLFKRNNMEREEWARMPLPALDAEWLSQLCRNPYWARSWIIQEILLSQNKVIWYGNHTINWVSFRLMHKRLETHDASLAASDHGKVFANITSTQFRTEFGGVDTANGTLKKGMGLADAIVQFKHLQSTDLLDAVYALRSLLAACYQNMVDVEYSTDPTCLFVNVAHIMAICPWASVDADTYLTACLALRERLGLSDCASQIEMILLTNSRISEAVLIKPCELDEFYALFREEILPGEIEDVDASEDMESQSFWFCPKTAGNCFLAQKRHADGQVSSEYRATKFSARRETVWTYYKSTSSMRVSRRTTTLRLREAWATFVGAVGQEIIACAMLPKG